MKTITILFVLAAGLCASAPSSSAFEQETISGANFRAVEAAMVELKRLGLSVENYQIFVWRRGSMLFVVFGSPADADLLRIGCAGPIPCLTVQLSVDDLRVIRSDYDAQNR